MWDNKGNYIYTNEFGYRYDYNVSDHGIAEKYPSFRICLKFVPYYANTCGADHYLGCRWMWGFFINNRMCTYMEGSKGKGWKNKKDAIAAVRKLGFKVTVY